MQAGAPVDQSNIRNFRDFLLQYNKLTENCFNVCISNLNSRKSTKEEDSCIDACVNRFVRYNQRAMGTFVEAQLKKREKEAKEAANLPFNLQPVEHLEGATEVNAPVGSGDVKVDPVLSEMNIPVSENEIAVETT
ncbi:mitochondrial import inner membrane translocase subunit Tim10 B-like [Lineus longissimus]|uniref:mitochondrial import inner membrane translocase subunit Tim10 B-like n=1 Tax=Lineus longissimus TaxID=88925 RepID=UPI002B4E1804